MNRILIVIAASLAFSGMAQANPGLAVYERECVSCHLPTGDGVPGVFPPLRKSDYFRKATPAQLVKILSNGLTGEVTVNGTRYNSAMPPVALTDDEMANVINYVSVSLNGGKPILKAADVPKLKAAK